MICGPGPTPAAAQRQPGPRDAAVRPRPTILFQVTRRGPSASSLARSPGQAGQGPGLAGLAAAQSPPTRRRRARKLRPCQGWPGGRRTVSAQLLARSRTTAAPASAIRRPGAAGPGPGTDSESEAGPPSPGHRLSPSPAARMP